MLMEPKIHLAILWHQHQPFYLETDAKRKYYRFPWVRLHVIRDYYSMAALVAQYPDVHLTINLVPSLLMQIEGYSQGFTDRILELTLKSVRQLSETEKSEILTTFFDADWHNQIYIYPRYRELFEKRKEGGLFSNQDITDLQMWFNLSWFAPELLEREVKLYDGTRFNLGLLVEKGSGFDTVDIQKMIEAQLAIMRNIIPLHRSLQDRGQIEVSTTPFYHPILPLIHDTNLAKQNFETCLPERFQAPEDAQAQVNLAVEFYKARFGRVPRGMWPAEGSVGQSIIDYFVRAGVRWIASDQGVLERSGKWGYRVQDPNVLCQAYRAEGTQGSTSIFFRDKGLSDAIGFKYQNFAEQSQAVEAFLGDLKNRLANSVSDSANRIVTIILDGENAWSSYRNAARPFLHALYQALSKDPEIKTVTFGEYLEGNPARSVPKHPIESQSKVYDLFHGSWIGDWDSGVNFATWIGEDEENQAWNLLKMVRDDLRTFNTSPDQLAEAFKALYAAEGSDWFWWFGKDQESGCDDIFDDLFRGHLKSVYKAAGKKVPSFLDTHIVPRSVTWAFTNPVASIQTHDRLTLRTNCAGTLRYSLDNGASFQESAMTQVGGVMAGLHAYAFTLGPFSEKTEAVIFEFRCSECGCGESGSCCGGKLQKVKVQNDLIGTKVKAYNEMENYL